MRPKKLIRMAKEQSLLSSVSSQAAENLRLLNMVAGLQKDNRALAAAITAPSAAPDRQALNQELAAANIRLVRKLQDCRLSRRQDHRHLAAVWGEMWKIADIMGASHDGNLPQKVLEMKGELEGLQDLLASLEQERSAMLQERTRNYARVHLAQKNLSAARSKMEAMEKEIADLQEYKDRVRSVINKSGLIREARP